MKVKDGLFKTISMILLCGIIIFVLLFALMLNGTIDNPFEKKPEDLSLSQSEIRLKKFKTFQLSAKILPGDMKNKRIVYKSDKPNIVSVNEITGYLEAKNNGIATITAYLDKYKDIKAECLVIVSDNDIRIEEIILSTNKVYLQVGNQYKINYKILPKEAALHEIEYMTGDPKVATVDSNGNIKAINSGTTLIVVSDKISGVYQEVEVNVYEKTNQDVPEKLELNPKKMTVSIGGSSQIEPIVSPEGANSDITYESMDSNIATVSDLGVVTGIKEGTTKILATTINGIEAFITVKVTSDIVKVKGINITNKNIMMNVGDSKKILYKINPSNATNQGVKITTDNGGVIKLDGTKIIAIKSGEAKVTIETIDGGYKDTAKVTVNKVAKIIEEKDIELSKNNVNIIVGGTDKIAASIIPTNATYKSLLWKSNDSSIATVSDGLIVGKGIGKTDIFVTSVYKGISKKISVTVREQEVQSINLDKKNANITVGDELVLVKTITPSNATNKNVTWNSSNPNVATVDNGLVKALSVGTTIITVRTNNNKTALCTINVVENRVPVADITLDKQVINTEVNDRIYITATITPSNATNKKIIWESSNESVAKVSDGVVETVGVGKTTIKASTINGKFATCEVIVKGENKIVDVTSITIDQQVLTLKVGEKETLHAAINPSNATNQNLTWESSDPSVAKVNANGIVKGVSEGTAIITVKTYNGKTATCKVTVESSSTTVPVTSVSLNNTSLSLKVGGTKNLVASVSPSNASNKNITWTSSNQNVASVSNSGVVTAVKEGTATITATSNNGKTATCKVTVEKEITTVPVTGVSLDKTSITLKENGKKTLVATISPSNATNKTITWTSSDSTVATVSSGGEVTGKKAGTTTITATSNNGKTATCKVTVEKEITSKRIKVGTFNVGSYHGGGHGCGDNCTPSPTAIGSFIKSKNVDIVGIQEGLDLSETQQLASVLGYNERHVQPGQINAILSKYNIKSVDYYALSNYGEGRAIIKVVVNINGVDISIYDSHFGGGNGAPTEQHFKEAAQIVAKDPNPVIFVADYNYVYKEWFNTHFPDFTIAAHDTSSENMWMYYDWWQKSHESYCDSVLVNGKGHIKVVKGDTYLAYNRYSDHNLVVATLDVY